VICLGAACLASHVLVIALDVQQVVAALQQNIAACKLMPYACLSFVYFAAFSELNQAELFDDYRVSSKATHS
jgi:hypothetical protein